jgi:hypothetical protein
MVLFFSSSNFLSVIAEPYYFNPTIISDLKVSINQKRSILGKLAFIDDMKVKINQIDNPKKNLIIIDIDNLRKTVLLQNLRQYTAEKYLA